jgi:hypothetical protein
MPQRSNIKWTSEDDRRLLELKGAGKSDRVIALALRRSPKSIGTRLGILKARSAVDAIRPSSQGSIQGPVLDSPGSPLGSKLSTSDSGR